MLPWPTLVESFKYRYWPADYFPFSLRRTDEHNQFSVFPLHSFSLSHQFYTYCHYFWFCILFHFETMSISLPGILTLNSIQFTILLCKVQDSLNYFNRFLCVQWCWNKQKALCVDHRDISHSDFHMWTCQFFMSLCMLSSLHLCLGANIFNLPMWQGG